MSPIALLALAAGCEELDDVTPKVNFQTMEIRDIDFEQVSADFVFSVDNPNPINIKLATFSYGFGLETIDLLSGDNQEGFELEAIGSSELVLPVDLTWQDAWDAVQATRGEDEVSFALDGDFGFNTPLGLAKIPYSEGGSFPAVRTPKFSFKNVRVSDLDLWTQTATIDVDLGVDNEHGSDLFFSGFNYDLDLGSGSVASGIIDEMGAIDGATNGTLVLPVEVNLLTAGATVVSALTGGGKLDIGLDATMDVDTPFGVLPLSIDETGDVNVTP